MNDQRSVLGSAEWVQQTHGWMTAAERRSPGSPGSDAPDQYGGSATHGRADASWAQRLHSGHATGGARDGVDPCGAEGGRRHPHSDIAASQLPDVPFRPRSGRARRVEVDAELLFAAAILHDTGLMNPLNGSDFTLSSMQLAREIADQVGLSTAATEVMQTAITMHYNPGVTTAAGTEAYLLSAGAAVDVAGIRSWDLPPQILHNASARLPASRVQKGVRARIPCRGGPRPAGTGKVREQVRRAHHRDQVGPVRRVRRARCHQATLSREGLSASVVNPGSGPRDAARQSEREPAPKQERCMRRRVQPQRPEPSSARGVG